MTWVGKIVLKKERMLDWREGVVRVGGQEKTRWGRAVGVSGKGRLACGVVGVTVLGVTEQKPQRQ